MTKKLKSALRSQKKQTKQEVPELAGRLGIELGGQRIVEVPHRNGFVYVRVWDNPNELIQAFNNKVSPSYNLPVLLERQNNRYVVTAVNSDRYQNNWTTFAPFLPRHGNTHSFDLENGGGGDIVWVQSRQFTPILVIPSGTLGGSNVVVSGYALKDTDGSWKYVGNTGTQNLDPYRPVTGTQAVMALVYLDTVSGNPQFLVNSGSYFPESITGTAQVLPYVPSITDLNHIPLAAVRLVTGSSAIGWNNIYDLRQFYYNITGGGAGSITVQDEGVSQGSASTFNFVGTNVQASVSGGVATISVTGSSGGVANLTGTFVGMPNRVVGTNSTGSLNALGFLAWNQPSRYLEWGADIPTKEVHSGKIGYETFSSGFFEFVGAGTSPNRWVRLYDNVKVNTHLQTNSFQNLGLLSTWIYLNGTGTAVGPINAPEKTFITGTDRVLGMNGQDGSFNSIQYTVNDLSEAIITTDVIGAFLDATQVTASTTFQASPFRMGSTATAGNFPWPEDGVIGNLSFRTSSSQPASGSLVVTLVVNNVATDLVATVPAGSANGTFSDNTHKVSIVAGDLIRWTIQNNATASSAAMTAVTMIISKRATA